MLRWSLLLFALAASPLLARPVEIVMVDHAAEKELGGFPLDRGQLAHAIEVIEHDGARAIVIKFFLDQPRTKEGDERLTATLKAGKVPVVLQARIDETELKPNPLAPRFIRTDLSLAPGAALAGTNGWLPLTSFADTATAVGFIDDLNPAPVLELYRGQTVPSLYLATLELMLGGKVEIEPNRSLRFKGPALPLDAKNRVHLPWPKEDNLAYVALLDLLRGTTPRGTLQDKVVILAYDGEQMQTFDTPIGKVKAHRLFYYELCSLYDYLTRPVPPALPGP